MANVKIRYYLSKKGRAYWNPSAKMKKCGFEAQPLGADGPKAWERAEQLNELWDKWCADPDSPKKPKRPGTLVHLFDEYHKTGQWKKKSPKTRYEWEYSFETIEPVFGDILVQNIDFCHVDHFYEGLLEHFSLHKAHRIMKTLRALFNVAIAFRLIKTNPTAGIKNRAPRGREEIWRPDEIKALALRAWSEGYPALSVAIRLAYDTELQPVDIRRLTPRQRAEDGQGVYFETRRAKTKKRAYATLTKETTVALDAYMSSLDFVIPADQPILRNRSGRAYSKDKLAADFRFIRDTLFEGDKRRLQDMRRTGNVEAAVGGAQPQDLSAKAGNTIAVSNALFETYTPVQLAAVRRADKARKRGRKALNRNKKR